MLLEKPYFLKNKEWHIENKDIPNFLTKETKEKRHYILTDKAPKKAIDSYNNFYKELDNIHNYLDELLKEYFKLFPKDNFFPEWYDASNEDKIEMLKEAIKEKKDISETKIFKEKYEEKVIYDLD
jgi:hypothetical protein